MLPYRCSTSRSPDLGRALLRLVLPLIAGLMAFAFTAAPMRAGSTTLVITEVQTAGSTNASDDFVEIRNISTDAISLNGYKLAYRNAANTTFNYVATVSADIVLQPGEHFLFFGSGHPAGDLLGNLSLSSVAGGVALLGNNIVVDSVAWGNPIPGHPFIEGQSAPAPTAGSSIERSSSGTDTDNNAHDFSLNSSPTPQMSNHRTLAIDDVSLSEDGPDSTTTFAFTVALSAPAPDAGVTVNYATTDGSATAGTDYVAASGTLTFTAGESSKTIEITVNGDSNFESDEIFIVNLSEASGGVIEDAQGIGTITNDDTAPAEGTPDPAFATNTNGLVHDLVVQPDGKIIIVGTFTTVNGATRDRVARLNSDGSLDTSFVAGVSGAGNTVYAVALLPDGKILLGGHFELVNDAHGRSRIARLHPNGSIDIGFISPVWDGLVHDIAVSPDGKALIAGRFNDRALARLNPDGSFDESFLGNPRAPSGSNFVACVSMQSDGKILIGGDFTHVGDTPRNKFARLLTDGSLDTTFAADSSGASDRVYAIAPSADGKVLIGGHFWTVNGESRPYLAQLTSTGSLDPTFLPSLAGPSDVVRRILPLNDGKLVVGGLFQTFNATARGSLARLHADGLLDREFLESPLVGAVPSSSAGGVLTLDLQDDGSLLIGGGFASFNNEAHDNIARLRSEPPAPAIVSLAAIGPASTSAASVEFQVTFSHRVTGVDTSDFVLTTSGLTGAAITSVTGSDRNYTVTVSTGTGSGTLRLDLVDDGSIVSAAAGIALHSGDTGTFTGETLTIVPPFVRLINRVSPHGPLLTAGATTLVFRVSFSEPVTGVDLGDFALTTTGDLTAEFSDLASANDGGEFYDATITIGSGEGTVRLDLKANATIADDAGNLIAAAAFTRGQTYTRIAGATAFAWGSGGYDNFSPLGENSTSDRAGPVFVNVRESLSALHGRSIIAVSTGGDHSLALDLQGNVYAWGSNRYGQLGRPIDLVMNDDDNEVSANNTRVPVAVASGAFAGKTIVAIAAGFAHSLALDADGTVYAWGMNQTGQLGLGSSTDQPSPTAVQPGAMAGRKIVAIAASGSFSLALDSDGRLYAWGINTNGELGNGNPGTHSNVPVAVTLSGALADTPFIAIATGQSQAAALAADGRVYAWGSNTRGEIGDNSMTSPRSTPTAVDITGALRGKTVTALAAGASHILALDSNGAIYAWGSGRVGELGNGSHPSSMLSPVAVSMIEDTSALFGREVVAIAAGGSRSFALTADGVICSWGSNDYGALGAESFASNSSVPIRVSTSVTSALRGARVLALATNNQESRHMLAVALSTGPVVTAATQVGGSSVYKHGDTLTFQLTFNRSVHVTGTPRLVLNFGQDDRFAEHIATSPDGKTLTFSYMVQAGDDAPYGFQLASFVDLSEGQIVDADDRAAAATPAFSAPVFNDILVDGTLPSVTSIVRTAGAAPATGLETVSFTVSFNEPIVVSGGELDAGDFTLRSVSDSVAGSIVSVRPLRAYAGDTRKRESASLQYRVTAAALSGAGVFRLDFTPDRVIGDAAGNLVTGNFTSGETYTRFDDASAFSWGRGTDGQLGDGEEATRFTPLPVLQTGALAEKTVVALAHGHTHTLALASDGKVYAWGHNEFGQLGDGSEENSAEPVAVDDSGVLAGNYLIAIAAGSDFSLALSADGKVFAWGRKIGDDASQAFDTAPVALPFSEVDDEAPAPHIVSIAAGADHALAMDENGILYGWGHNGSVQLGFFASSVEPQPTPILPYARVAVIAAGGHHTLALMTNGEIFACGANHAGQVGLGYTDIFGFGGVQFPDNEQPAIVALAAGDRHSLALDSTGRLYTWGANNAGQLGLGSDEAHLSQPTRLDDLAFVSVAAGHSHVLALATDGRIYGWGSNDSGQLAREPAGPILAPQALDLPGLAAHYILGAGPLADHSTVVSQIEETSTPDLTDDSDTGASDSDNLTKLATPTFVGTAPAGANVTLFAGANEIGSTTADAVTGAWTIASAFLADGVHNIAARSTLLGVTSAPTAALVVTIDTATPLVSSGSTATATVNTAFAGYTISATDAHGPLDYAASGLPAGLSVDATSGAITGVPAAAGTFSATVSATDHAGNRSSQTVVFTVHAATHSADTDRNWRLSLLELTRVIELYNTRDGTTRTGAYHSEHDTEDGFAPGAGSIASHHSADTNRDGKLSLLELTRVIELYNARDGTTRTGEYHRTEFETEDGFAPGTPMHH